MNKIIFPFICFVAGALLFIATSYFIVANWEQYYLPDMSPGLLKSYANGYLKPAFDLTSKSLLHTELVIAVAAILLMLIKPFRNLKCLLFFGVGLYVAGIVTMMFQNKDSNLWPLALFVYAAYLILPALVAGYTMILLLKPDNSRKRK